MVTILRGEPPIEMLFGNGNGNGYGNGYGDGNGYGYGYGNGNGYGYGYGDGYGDGYGNGDGNGNGYGDGYGDGYGNGYGDGNGYGYGYGNGNGNGYGNGYGDGYYGNGPETIYYWSQTLDGMVPESKRAKLSKAGAITAYWRSTKTGEPANGGSGTKAKPGLVEITDGDLKICHNGFHATLNPPKWRGERVWVVALYPPFQFDEDKIASLKREFICEAPFKL